MFIRAATVYLKFLGEKAPRDFDSAEPDPPQHNQMNVCYKKSKWWFLTLGRRLPYRHGTRDFKTFHLHVGTLTTQSATFVTSYVGSTAVMYVPSTEFVVREW